MKRKNSIIKYIEGLNLDYSKPIPVECISGIMNYRWWDFYIEWLTSNCWDWEMNLYLDYYDSNANAVICIDEMEWSYVLEGPEDIYDLIISCAERVRCYRDKLLILKKE